MKRQIFYRLTEILSFYALLRPDEYGFHIFFLVYRDMEYALGRVKEGVTNKVMEVGIARNGGCLLFFSVILDFSGIYYLLVQLYCA